MFANFHRLSAETYKAMELELFTGAASLMAEYNGIIKKAHVREKLTWLVMYTEAVETLGQGRRGALRGRRGIRPRLSQPDDRQHLQVLLRRQLAHGDQVHPGHRRRHHRDRAVVQGLLQPRDPRLHGEVLRRQGRRADRAPAAHGQAHPRPDLLPTRTCSPSTPKARWRRRRCPSCSWPTGAATARRPCGRPASRAPRSTRSSPNCRSSRRETL